MHESIVHLYTECPEGSIIAIAKRDSVNTMDPEAMKDLVWCSWCQRRTRSIIRRGTITGSPNPARRKFNSNAAARASPLLLVGATRSL
jgi:hypothetical protein